MSTTTIPELNEQTDMVHHRPAISVLLSLDQMQHSKERVKQSIKQATKKVEKQLLEHYSGEIVLLMMGKLCQIIDTINYSSSKKSIAIYLSPIFEKMLYLNIPVNEMAIVDESFETRDIILNKKQLKKYLVLYVDAKEYRIYEGKENSLRLILCNSSGAYYDGYKDALTEIPGADSNSTEAKELIRKHFLNHARNTLDILLDAYHLPVFVLGAKQVVNQFKDIIGNSSAIIDFLYSSQDIVEVKDIQKILEPYIADWKLVKHLIVKKQLEEAERKQKLTSGIKNVLEEVLAHKGKLLVVEKNFIHPEEHDRKGCQIYSVIKSDNKFSYITDTVDVVIEKILEAGGDVEFVEEGCLENYDRIALIHRY